MYTNHQEDNSLVNSCEEGQLKSWYELPHNATAFLPLRRTRHGQCSGSHPVHTPRPEVNA
jgi:hypothetical protein